uniref:Uncharacterized protein n=1 Tax=Oryza meridionalis TaxID=40149 RepID=A0A0E0DG97_9ORYZ
MEAFIQQQLMRVMRVDLLKERVRGVVSLLGQIIRLNCTFGKKDGNVAEDSADSLSCLYLGSDRTENISNNQAPVRSSVLHPTDSMPTDAMPLLLTPTLGPPIDAPQPETTAVVHESAGEASTTSFDWSKLTEMGYRAVEVIQTWSSEVKLLKTIFVEEKDRNEHLKTMLGEEKDKNECLKIMLAMDKDKNEHHMTMLAEERDRNERLKIMLMWEKDRNEHYKTMLAQEKDKAEHHNNMLEEEKDNNKRLKTMLVEEKDKNKHHKIILEEEKDKNERLKTMLSEEKVKNEHLKSMLAEEKDKNERLQLRLHGEEKDKNELLKTMLAEKKDKNDRLQLSFPKNEHLPLGLQRVHTRLDECIALIDRITQKDTTGGAGPDSYPSSVSMARGRGGRTKGGSVGHSGKRGRPSAMAEEPEGGAARKRRKQDDPKDSDGSFHSPANESGDTGPVQGEGVEMSQLGQIIRLNCTFGKKKSSVAEDSADSLSFLYLGSDWIENKSNKQAPVRSGPCPSFTLTDAMPLLTPTSGPAVDTPWPEMTTAIRDSAGGAPTTPFDWSKLTEMAQQAVEVIQTQTSEVEHLRATLVEEANKIGDLKTMLAEEKDKNEHHKTMLEEEKDKNERLNTMLVEEKEKNERLQLSLHQANTKLGQSMPYADVLGILDKSIDKAFQKRDMKKSSWKKL